MLSKGIKDLTGLRFGKWEVLKFDSIIKGGPAYWLCRCDCGKEFSVVGTGLRAGRSKSCKQCAIPGVLATEESVRHSWFVHYFWGARTRNIEWNLLETDFNELVLSNCIYCGNSPTPRTIKKCSANYNKFVSFNGLDRVDSSLGYILGNVVPCCSTCNYAKRKMSKVEFLKWIEKVYLHNASTI